MAGLELGLKDRHGEPVGGARRGEATHRGAVDSNCSAQAAEQRLPLAMRRSDDDVKRRYCFGSSGCVARRALGAGPAGGGRRRGNRTRSCWRRFGPISLGPRSTAKAIARSTPGFGSDGIRVARTRVLRVMGRMLSPHRGRWLVATWGTSDSRRRVGLDLRGGRTSGDVCMIGVDYGLGAKIGSWIQ